ncbi:hypothetical protein IW140_002287 [Coemansia sp. RSA 1813]|nr:hypothetical protein EV178_001796 [Coemansia sp. RSA 1646]KAJ1770890.1 hypothetical protein LPJ74_002786 [Coemansia sp. RSA 1843]KAJ2092891.1 hypothetical protein IW138_000604 [Coemansia sp. RSA 986]KAJ2216212.1 hypothetical protein EV179_001450 [Coemansia sp. RSA 487]KAJ2570615.1 hypothetical protein IW140_002287 [Coemansia sp. RSA 1813]
MGFKKPKTTKSTRNPLDEDNSVERNLEPSNILSGGRKLSKRKTKTISDAPKSFQYLMQFMERKKQRDQELANNKKRKRKQPTASKNIGNLNIMPGESMPEFERRVNQKMYANLQRVDKGEDVTDQKVHDNPSRDDGEEIVVSKRTDRKRRNDVVRKQRKMAKKHKDADDMEDVAKSKSVEEPKFGEQASAPPIFRALPKEKIKKMVPLPNSKEEKTEQKLRDELAVKKMIQKTARLSPLEKMQAKRKAKELGDSAAEKRIMEAEREKAIRRYRMLRAVRESSAASKS